MKSMGTECQKMDGDFFQKYRHLSFLENTAIEEKETACSVDYFDEDTQDTKIIFEQTVLQENISVVNSETTNESFIDSQNSKNMTNDANKEGSKDPPGRKKLRLSNEHMSQEFKKSREERTSVIKEFHTTQPQQDSAVSLFFQSIAATVSKFTPQFQANAKVQIMNTVAQLELQNLQLNSRPISSIGSETYANVINGLSSPLNNENISYQYPQQRSATSGIKMEPKFLHDNKML